MTISMATLSFAMQGVADRLDAMSRRALSHRDAKEEADEHRNLALEVAKTVLAREMEVPTERRCRGACECAKNGMGCCSCLPFGEEEMDRAFACGKAFADRAVKEGLIADPVRLKEAREAQQRTACEMAQMFVGSQKPKEGQ